MKLVTCSTGDYHGYNVEFSPFYPDVFACAASKNYGLSGPGALLIFQRATDGSYQQTHKYDWQDGVFDLSWSKVDQNLIASSSGDGSIQIWNMLDPDVCYGFLRGHSKEVYGVEWGRAQNANTLLSASWDETIRLWDVHNSTELSQFSGHQSIVYSALWSPHRPEVFASIGGDGALKLWDARFNDLLPQNIPAHNGDVLACDWSHLNEHMIATGGVDKAIHVWDLREPESPVSTLLGHQYAIRRVKFSPFHAHLLASVSYDFNTCLWNWHSGRAIDTYSHHKEFVYGLDFSHHIPDVMMDCAWDSLIRIYERISFNL